MGRIVGVSLAVALVAGGAVGLSYATASTTGYPSCSSGVIATDPAGDHTYANQDQPELEDGALDLLAIAVEPAAGDTFVLTTSLAEVRDDDPAGGLGMSVSIELATGVTDPVAVEIDRSVTAGTQSATVGEADVTDSLVFDTAAGTIRVTAPVSALGEGVTSIAVSNAETRATTPAIVAPLADTASGTCAAPVVASGDTGSGGGKPEAGNSGRTPGEGNGKGKGNKPRDGGGTGGGEPVPSFDPKSVTVAIVDTGVHAAHDEFDFDETVGGPNGQLVGWWDFSGMNTSGATPDAWYEGHAPYDPDMSSPAHGTGTSAMAVGRNRTPSKTLSACPGCNLAVAKTLNEGDISDTADDVIDGDIGAAIRWATDVIGADVVSISIGSRAFGVVGYPGWLLAPETYDAISYARSQGVLVVFSNGNGWYNAGGPGEPGVISPYGNSPHALSVGASDIDGAMVTTDPDVAALFTVMTADNAGTYHSISGTSFSAPFVAGGAARVIAEAKACGASAPAPSDLETLIKYTATDTVVPPTFEGYGVVDLATIALAADVVCGDAELPAPAPETDAYMTALVEPARAAWAHGQAPTPISTTPITGVTPAGVLGASAPAGTADAEIYEATVAPGATLTVDATYGSSALAPLEDAAGAVQDFDMVLYRASSTGTYDPSAMLVKGGESAGVAEQISYTNTTSAPVTVHLVVYGWSIVTDQPFTVSGVPATPVFDGYVTFAQTIL